VLDILPKGSKFGQLYFVDYMFPDLEREKVNFHRRIPQTTFRHLWTIQYATVDRRWHQIREASCFTIIAPTLFVSLCDFWLFTMLKGVLKDREFNSGDEIEEAVTNIGDELPFDEVQSVFHNWMSRFAWFIEDGREYLFK
jgi:hypothetical protein